MNLEATNVAALGRQLVPETIELIAMDLSYLPVAEAVPQLEGISIADDADLIALVKLMFELCVARPPKDPEMLRKVVEQATAAIETNREKVVGQIPSPTYGARGAREWLSTQDERIALTIAAVTYLLPTAGGQSSERRKLPKRIEPPAGLEPATC